MYGTAPTLDFSGALWYHMGVKLGCYATVPLGFDPTVFTCNRGSPLPKKGDGNGEFLLRGKAFG